MTVVIKSIILLWLVYLIISNVTLIILAVTKTDINMEQQKVYVTTTLSSDEVLAILKKTGREVTYIGATQ